MSELHITSLADVDVSDTLFIAYKNPFNPDSQIMDMAFSNKREMIQGLKLGVRLGLEMKFTFGSQKIEDFVNEYLNYYMS